MRLTRRGWAVVGIVAFCLLMAWQYGARSLNAIVAPLVVVLVAAAISLARTDRLDLHRKPIPKGFVGETRSVEFAIDATGPIAAVVEDSHSDAITVLDGRGETTLVPDGTYSYEVRLESRGEHQFGPVRITITDLLGLVERIFEYQASETVLVYPPVSDLRSGSQEDLRALTDAVRDYNREEFDHLREYERGDSIRDIHWKSSAKRGTDEFVVKEFISEDEIGSAELRVESTPGHDDDVAAAAASVATFLLNRNVAVGITSADGSRRPDRGRNHHRQLLELLARTGPGRTRHHDGHTPDVVIQSDATGTTVSLDDREIPFERLAGTEIREPTAVFGLGAGEVPSVVESEGVIG